MMIDETKFTFAFNTTAYYLLLLAENEHHRDLCIISAITYTRMHIRIHQIYKIDQRMEKKYNEMFFPDNPFIDG